MNVWADAETRYQTGQEVRGVVTRVAHFGVFVQVEPGLEGILYTFELGPGPGALANFAPGQEVRLYVKDVDGRRKRLELGLEHRPVPGLVSEQAVPDEARRKALPEEPGTIQSFPHATPGGRTERRCPTCQRQVQCTWRYCVYCGGTLQRRCPVCGTTQPDLPDARYCCACGKLLG